MGIGATAITSPPKLPAAKLVHIFLRRSWLTVWLSLLAVVAVVAIAVWRAPRVWDGLGWDASRLAAFEPVIYVKAGLRTALMALVFSAIYLLVAKAVGSVYRVLADRFRARPWMQFGLELVIYLVFVGVALMPMSMLMEFDAVRALGANSRALILLLMINGLFFFIGVSYVDFMINESYKTYATSAEFKSTCKAAMTREASWQFLLARWTSIYYFVLTFTMVPEIIEPSTTILFRDQLGDNIVKSIFHTIFHEPNAISLLWLQSLAFVATALLFRLVIDAVVLWYDLKIGLVTRAGA